MLCTKVWSILFLQLNEGSNKSWVGLNTQGNVNSWGGIKNEYLCVKPQDRGYRETETLPLISMLLVFLKSLSRTCHCQIHYTKWSFNHRYDGVLYIYV